MRNSAPELAAYFGLRPEILALLPELLVDLDELGSEPQVVADWLQEAGLHGRASRVLDLGCGKGAVALAIAARLGCTVRGVDLFTPFVEDARARAVARGLEELCQFETGDVRDVVQVARDYGAVLFVSIGGVLGPLDACVRQLRRCVHATGLVVIDHGYLAGADEVAFEHMVPRTAAIAQLESCGDEIVRERVLSLKEVRNQNQRYGASIARRAAVLIERRPRDAEAIMAYLEKERRESECLERSVRCATWMLRVRR